MLGRPLQANLMSGPQGVPTHPTPCANRHVRCSVVIILVSGPRQPAHVNQGAGQRQAAAHHTVALSFRLSFILPSIPAGVGRMSPPFLG